MSSVEQPFQLTLAQARAVGGLADEAATSISPDPSEALRRTHVIGLWPDEELVHVLLAPPFEWVSIDPTGRTVPRDRARRTEVVTVALRASSRWADLRRLLRERSVDPATTVMAEALQDDVDLDVGVLVTSTGRVIEWQRRYDEDDEERPGAIVGWRDLTTPWGGSARTGQVEAALALRHGGLRRLRPPT